MRRPRLGTLITAAALLLGLASCAPPTPEQACKAAAARFNECGTEKWGDKQIATCKADFEATTTMKDYTKTLKKCSEMKECEISEKCMMVILVAVGEDAQK